MTFKKQKKQKNMAEHDTNTSFPEKSLRIKR